MKHLASILIGAALSAGLMFAQDAKQDMKNAGSDTKAAAKNTGRGIKKGTKHAVHKASGKTAEGASKVHAKTE